MSQVKPVLPWAAPIAGVELSIVTFLPTVSREQNPSKVAFHFWYTQYRGCWSSQKPGANAVVVQFMTASRRLTPSSHDSLQTQRDLSWAKSTVDRAYPQVQWGILRFWMKISYVLVIAIRVTGLACSICPVGNKHCGSTLKR